MLSRKVSPLKPPITLVSTTHIHLMHLGKHSTEYVFHVCPLKESLENVVGVKILPVESLTLVPLPVCLLRTKSIILSSIWGITQTCVGLAQLLEGLRSRGRPIPIWVEFQRQLSIGSLDLVLRSCFGDAQDLIVIFFLKNLLAELFLDRD